MKRWISTLLCAAVCTMAGANAAEPEKKDVSLSVGSMILNYMPVPLTQSLGNFQKEGLNVKVENFQAGGSKALQALIAGSTDAVVALLNTTPGIVLAVRPDLDIKSGKDLKGKKIGITAPGSSTDLFARYYAIKSGLQVNDVSYIAVGSGAPGMVALDRKEIDALVNFDPVASLLEKRRAAKFLVDTRTDAGSNAVFGGRYPTATLYVTRDFMTKNPETVQRLVNAFIRTLKWIDASTPEAIADKMPKEQQVGGRDVFVDALRHSKPIFSKDGLMTEADAKVALTVLSSYDEKIRNAKIDLTKTYTNRFVDQALKTVQ